MTDAPEKIWANANIGDGGFWACDADVYDQGDASEYHIARPGQPCSTDEFLRRLHSSNYGVYGKDKAVAEWIEGDFTSAMEGLE